MRGLWRWYNVCMKKLSILFLQTLLVVKILAILALCIFVFPTFKDGIVAEFPQIPNIQTLALIGVVCLYGACVAILVMLFNIIKLFRYIGQNIFFSISSLKTLKNIKTNALTGGIFFVGWMPLMFAVAEWDDAPGLMFFGSIPMLSMVVVFVFAGVVEGLVENVMHDVRQ